MEILKSEQYISEKLNITPVTKDRLDSVKEPLTDSETRRFIEDNNLVWNPSTRRYDCDGNVIIPNDIVSDGRLKIRFGHVKGYFNCSFSELTTLDGAPQEVGGYFDCSGNRLTSLEGAPRKVGDGFDCSDNNLKTLEGAPQKVKDGFNCSDNELTNLKGAPQEVSGNLYCSDNPNLVLPKTKPSWIKGKIITTSWRTAES